MTHGMDGMMGSMMSWMMALGLLGWLLVIGLLVAILTVLAKLLHRERTAGAKQADGENATRRPRAP